MTRIPSVPTPSVSSQFVSRCTREWLPGWRCISSATEKETKMHKHHHPGLLVVDIQGKLARLVEESDALIANTARLVQGPGCWGCRLSGWSRTRTSSVPPCPNCNRCRQAILCCPNTASAPWGAHCGDRAGRKRGSSIGWYVASRPISASTRACWDFWPAAPGLAGGGCGVVSLRCQPGSRHRQLAARGAALTSVEMCLYELMGTAAIRHFARSSPW